MPFLAVLLKLLPSILNSIVMVEQMFPNATGAGKKSVVMAAVQKAANVADDVRQVADQLVPAVSGLIDSTVTALNENDLWPKGQEELKSIQAGAASALSVVRAVDDELKAAFPVAVGD